MWHQIGRRIGFAPFLSRLSTLSESVNKVKVSDVTISTAPTEKLPSENLTPTRVVEMLDRHIIGQKEAKKAVAIAFRNRWRRHRIPPELKEEVVPKNILMIGPTGCGKTEIARRLAKLADAPFVKVEATKFTEVGFHGRDVDQIIRDLVENTIQLLKHKVRSHKVAEVESTVEAIILDNVFKRSVENECTPSSLGDNYEEYRKCYRDGNFDNMKIIMELPSRGRGASFPVVGDFSDIVGKVLQLGKVSKPPKWEVQESTVKEARERLEEAEYEKLFNSDQIIKDAIMFAESDGIIFIDEIDKIVTSPDMRHGHEASSEGVQRDLLPLLEGSTVETKYGSVKTDHILFICSGAFHSCKPSDMLAELQGRLPIRVELQGLTCKDFYRILTEPEANLIKQQVALMETENVKLVFSDDAIKEMSFIAAEINKTVQNIGARRLHTVIERVVEDASFNASEKGGETYIIGKEEVRMALGSFLTKSDLSRFIL